MHKSNYSQNKTHHINVSTIQICMKEELRKIAKLNNQIYRKKWKSFLNITWQHRRLYKTYLHTYIPARFQIQMKKTNSKKKRIYKTLKNICPHPGKIERYSFRRKDGYCTCIHVCLQMWLRCQYKHRKILRLHLSF